MNKNSHLVYCTISLKYCFTVAFAVFVKMLVHLLVREVEKDELGQCIFFFWRISYSVNRKDLLVIAVCKNLMWWCQQIWVATLCTSESTSQNIQTKLIEKLHRFVQALKKTAWLDKCYTQLHLFNIATRCTGDLCSQPMCCLKTNSVSVTSTVVRAIFSKVTTQNNNFPQKIFLIFFFLLRKVCISKSLRDSAK